MDSYTYSIHAVGPLNIGLYNCVSGRLGRLSALVVEILSLVYPLLGCSWTA